MMEHLKITFKSWLKSIIKPIMFREILDDIKKMILKVWQLRFAIFVFVLFFMVLNLHMAVGKINSTIGSYTQNTSAGVSISNFRIFNSLAFPACTDRKPAAENLST